MNELLGGKQDFLGMLINKYPELNTCIPSIEQAYQMMVDVYQNEGKAMFCGNGGSAADCDHIVGELMKGFMLKRPLQAKDRQRFVNAYPEEGNSIADRLQGALPALSLCNASAFITAYANDVSAEMIFAQQVYGYGKPGDVLIGLSTSGNSVNVIRAMQVAKVQGIQTIGFTGENGGKMKSYCDVVIQVPWDETPGIQERHLPIYHSLCLMLEDAFFGDTT